MSTAGTTHAGTPLLLLLVLSSVASRDVLFMASLFRVFFRVFLRVIAVVDVVDDVEGVEASSCAS